MPAKKRNKDTKKGLSDVELIRKYEAGKFNLKKAVSTMIKAGSSKKKKK